MQILRNWFRRQFSNPQVVILTVLLVAFLAAIIFLANMLAPLVAAVVIAYLLQGPVSRLEQFGVGHLTAVLAVFLGFIVLLLLGVFILLPLLFGQLTRLFQQAPDMITQAQFILMELPERYPNFVSYEQIELFMETLRNEVIGWTQQLVTYSVSSVVAVVMIVVYVVLVPFLVFFLIKDKDVILSWLEGFLPEERELARRVWADVDAQISNYIRGKFVEILIVGVVTYVVFSLLGLRFAALLAALTGLSVLIPYVGAAIVTFPVALAAYFQWGLTSEFAYALAAYGIIQALDGNVLAPLIFSEAVNLHPVAIIAAILFFGGLWGFWGVFFAVPFATVVQAVLRAWPRQARDPPLYAEPPTLITEDLQSEPGE